MHIRCVCRGNIKARYKRRNLFNVRTSGYTSEVPPVKKYKVPPGLPTEPVGMGQVVKVYPPPSDPTRMIATSSEVKAAMDIIKTLTFPEMVAFGNELRKHMGHTEAQFEEEMLKLTGLPIGFGKFTGPMDLTGGAATTTSAQAAPTEEKPAEAAPAAAGKEDKKKGPPPKEEKKGLANVKLISYPEVKKINVLKELRKVKPGMSLVDSKKLVENLPQILHKGATAEEQKKWKDALEKEGAVLEFS